MRVGGEQGHVGLGVGGGEQVLRAGVAVVVVRLDRLVALRRAAVDPAVHLRGDPLPLVRGPEVEQGLAPVLVDDEVAGGVAQQQVGSPLSLFAGLDLEGVHVADVVEPGGGCRRPVAADDLDTGGRGVGAADLVVEVRVGRRQGDGRLRLFRFKAATAAVTARAAVSAASTKRRVRLSGRVSDIAPFLTHEVSGGRRTPTSSRRRRSTPVTRSWTAPSRWPWWVRGRSRRTRVAF